MRNVYTIQQSKYCTLYFPNPRFSNFAIEYLRENKKFRETDFICSYGAQLESYK